MCILYIVLKNRDVAQLVAHLAWDEGAAGSSPVIPTILKTIMLYTPFCAYLIMLIL